MAADAAAALVSVGINGTDVKAVVNIQPLVAGADPAGGAGIGGADFTCVIAIDDGTLAPAGADDPADALGVCTLDGRKVCAVFNVNPSRCLLYTSRCV